MPAPLSIKVLLATAQERQLWPELDRTGDAAELAAADTGPAVSPLQAAVSALGPQVEQTLGARTVVVGQQLDKLRELLGTPQPTGDVNAAWAALDELEDQLEALLRD